MQIKSEWLKLIQCPILVRLVQLDLINVGRNMKWYSHWKSLAVSYKVILNPAIALRGSCHTEIKSLPTQILFVHGHSNFEIAKNWKQPVSFTGQLVGTVTKEIVTCNSYGSQYHPDYKKPTQKVICVPYYVCKTKTIIVMGKKPMVARDLRDVVELNYIAQGSLVTTGLSPDCGGDTN